jgi:cyclophilin family peptidyl-prolyl cis-trans isomerase
MASRFCAPYLAKLDKSRDTPAHMKTSALLSATILSGVFFGTFLLNSMPASAQSDKDTDVKAASVPSKKTEHKPDKKTDNAKSKGKGNSMTPVVVIETSMGNIEIELNKEKAPNSVDNFLKYVDEGFYSGTIFHRVIPTFMVQGGGFTESMSQKPVHAPIKNEAANGLKNVKGSLAMARTGDPHSATAQFFINTVDNDFLNYRSSDERGFGYAVFGKVISGMDVVEKIKAVGTTTKGPYENVPTTPVVMKSVHRK